MFIYVAFLGQKQQLLQQDAEMEEQKQQFTAQHESIKRQNFENSFFQLLNLHSQTFAWMHERKTGGTFFKYCYDEMKGAFNHIQPKGKTHGGQWIELEQKSDKGNAVEAYLFTYNPRHQLARYFRNFYHLIKFVKQSDISNKRRYTSLVTAQLSSYEIALLFYNCISPLGEEKFKPLVEEFGLLEQLDKKMLLHPSDEGFYGKGAYE